MATVICPNCGGENNVTKKDGQECSYCGTLLHLQTSKQSKSKDTVADKGSKKLSEEKYIVPIPSRYSTRKGVENVLKTYLVGQDDVPADIFDHLEVKTVKWIYLPMWRYNGEISTEWSCDKVVYKKRKVGEEAKYDSKGNFLRMEAIFETYEDYLPKSGHGHTTFDILVPAIEKIKEELPYRSIDFYIIGEHNANQIKEGMSPIPASASIRKSTIEVDSESVLTNLGRAIKHKAEKCSFGNFIPRSSGLPHSVIAGRECVHEHLNVKYHLNENGTIGELYYIPFVRVVYSYKGDTYEWGFMLDCDNVGVYDTPTDLDKSVDEGIDIQKGNSNQLRSKWNLFLFVSGMLSFLVGMIIFLVRNISLYERIGKRYQNQESMHSLLGIYERRNNLLKHGADKKAIAEIDAKIKEEYDDEEFEEDDDKTPKSIAEINLYFAETEVLKQKLLKRMRHFWFWYISIIIIVGGGIVGYNYYSSKIEQERLQEEMQQQEREFNALKIKVEDDVCTQFLSRFQNITYEGTEDMLGSSQIRIKVLDKERLEYQLGTANVLLSANWESPKIVNYTLDINVTENNSSSSGDNYRVSAVFRFADYESLDLLNGDVYGTHKVDIYVRLTNKTSNKSFILHEKR